MCQVGIFKDTTCARLGYLRVLYVLYFIVPINTGVVIILGLKNRTYKDDLILCTLLFSLAGEHRPDDFRDGSPGRGGAAKHCRRGELGQRGKQLYSIKSSSSSRIRIITQHTCVSFLTRLARQAA